MKIVITPNNKKKRNKHTAEKDADERKYRASIMAMQPLTRVRAA